MKPGDTVIHRKTQQKMTVKAMAGHQVLCCWMQKNAAGNSVECSAAFPWEDLHYPPAEPAATAPALAEPAPTKETVHAPRKR